jgi:hypothetical protein
MSAFIVDNETMARVVGGLERLRKESPIYWGHEYERYFNGSNAENPDWQAIGQFLFQLNRKAVNHRYRESDESPNYQHKRSIDSAVQQLKAMQCLRYQCSEGDFEDNPAHIALNRTIGSLAEVIVRGLPEYEQAKWG